MAFTNAGTPLTTRISFNTGTIDFGNQRAVIVDNISITFEYTIATLYILGSIRAADKARHSEKVTFTAKVKSYAPELEMMAFGSSTTGATQQAMSIDGQATLLNPVVTVFDRNNKQIQYQLLNALFKSTKLTARMEEYAEWDLELEAIDMVEIYTV